MTTKHPMTVAELIEKLRAFDPAMLVMVECEDDYYSCPLTLENLTIGEALLIEPHDWQGPAEDDRGNKIKPRTYHYEGGWQSLSEGSSEEPGHIVERRPALILSIP